MSNVHHFQQRLEQSRVAKSVLRPADQVHWDILVSRVCEPEVARLIVRFLDKAPSEKLKHAGLYLRANLVLGDAYAKAEEEAKQKRKSRLHVMARALTSIGFYLYPPSRRVLTLCGSWHSAQSGVNHVCIRIQYRFHISDHEL